MTTQTYTCPDCQRLIDVRVRNDCGVYSTEFFDARGYQRATCDCGLPLYEALAQRRLQPFPATTTEPPHRSTPCN